MAEPVDQPFGGEVRGRADRQHAGTLPLQQALGAERDAIEGVAHDGKVVPAGVGDDEALALAIEELDPELQVSSALTWWLTAPCVTNSSAAARVKLSWRAAASKARSAFSGGRRRSIGPYFMKKTKAG